MVELVDKIAPQRLATERADALGGLDRFRALEHGQPPPEPEMLRRAAGVAALLSDVVRLGPELVERVAALDLRQLRRDRLTFAMIVGIPTMQLLLFGFAINSDPKHLPTAVVMADPGPFARAYVAAMCCGMLQASLETAVRYTQQRKTFGQPVLDHQGVRWTLVDAATDLEAARRTQCKNNLKQIGFI